MRIAVIEDERPIREGLVHILNKISPEYQVVGSAENGREGLILLEEQDPDLILLDIQMPDMNGLQMLKEARKRGSMTKVVILTAYSDFDYAKKAIALGIENYLLKPVNLTELKNTLSKIKEEIFVEQRGKNSLSLETVIKDALEGEYEEDSRLEETLLEKYGFSGRKQIYCMYLFMGRVKMINETKPVLTVSIHQNSYEDPEIHGAQVFYYSHSREGEAVAKILQESLQEIDPENHRQAKANETYYLLRRTKVPTVIVECGFLTNPEEAEKLSGEEYQEQVAEAVAKGIAKCLEYLNEYGN